MRPALRRILRPLPSLVLTDSPVNVNDLPTYTFNSVSFGRAAPGRKIIIAVNGGVGGVQSADITSLTVAGVAARRAVQILTDTSSNRVAALYAIENENDASGTVVLNFSGSLARMGIVVFAAYGISSIIPFSTGTGTITTGTATGSATVQAPSRGITIATSHFSAASLFTATWASPFTEDVDEVVETTVSQHTASCVNVNGLVTASVTFGGNATVNSPLVVASWGP
jgi:hypothetical protein